MAVTLVVDIGNTAVKWAWLDRPGGLSKFGYARHDGGSMPGLVANAWLQGDRPAAVWMASVAARPLADRTAEWVARQWGLAARQVGAECAALGVVNGYHDASQLGVDRWLALIGARARHSGPVCVVDCGTAVTVDALDARGHHLGGFILPGVTLSRRALLEHTHIPRIEDAQTAEGFGTDTATAVANGSRRAIAGVIDFAIAKLAGAGDAPALLITGSEAAQLTPVLTRPFTKVPHLVLEGLARYARSG